MPYKTVTEARKSIPSLKGLDTKQVKKFIKVFNALVKDGSEESKAIPIAISQAKKEDKLKKSTTTSPDEEKINTLNELISKASSENLEQMIQLYLEVEQSNVDTTSPTNITITKAVNQEERLALFVALPVKDENIDDSDLHLDSYSAEEVRKAMLNYNEHCMKAGVYHLYETSDATVTQSYLAPTDMTIVGVDGEERVIKSGWWLQEWHFPETDKGDALWDKVKGGELTGISVQCNCVVEDIDE